MEERPMPRTSEPSPTSRRPTVHGIDVTPTTQCRHWHSPLDVIAIKHRCCRVYYACISCHESLAGHENAVWSKEEQETEKAVMCGKCGLEMTPREYMACGNTCGRCGVGFNPGCSKHYHLYFNVEQSCSS
ncbi:zinc finger CHY domain protein [Gonapodya prolifera JEL478]|uniref:Zinc finger CHY domain protein n=1 Tax=Gonapodya prolifera (strain JEL478) TaxID=1344416 RepID=A0A139AEQ0_GONPJ|nr:zinc finger CHY domain protein [Gonapodya prolifera JEL478]|eukprot:KXS15238.1 zinc finger CHY domain protein [Gonapodya prolifera JEL478]